MKPVHVRIILLIIPLLLAACKPGSSASSQPEHWEESPTPILEPSATHQDKTPSATPFVVEVDTRFEQCAQIETTPLGILRLAWIETGDLWIWDWGEKEPYLLTALGDITAARFTKDGSEVVFTRQTGDSAEIWFVNADGSNIRLLTAGQILTGQIQIIDFSFDEAWLAFTHLLTENGGELWAARLDGSEAKRLVNHDPPKVLTQRKNGLQEAYLP